MLPPTNKHSSKRRKHRFGILLLLVVWAAVLGLVAINRQNILDWWMLRHYTAPAVVAQLAAQDSLTDSARKIFYVNKPSVDNKSDFSTVCPGNGREQTIVLGCYHGNQSGIFILNVADERLSGVQQVTAAHEMLHAAYDRLSPSERQRVDAMLIDYYEHDLRDERIQDTMAAYKKTEPNDLVNEMHSVFGSEIANLPTGLDKYYKRYFNNRTVVTSYAAQYQSAFTSRQTILSQKGSQLAQLKSQIDANKADLKTKEDDLKTQYDTLVSKRDSGDVTAYNSRVPFYNRLLETYKSEVQATQNLIDRYNNLLASYNAIVFEEDQLVKELGGVTPIKQ